MGEVFELTVDVMAHGGDALGWHEGKAIFVPYAIPGERVRVEVVDDRERYAHARLLEVLTPSSSRIEPPCPHFGPGRCGGCHWQHIAYPVQARLKGLVVVDQLERIGKLEEPPVLEPILDETGWAYRNRATFHTDAQGHLGFRTMRSHKITPIASCPILCDPLNDLLAALDMAYPELEWMTLRAGIATDDLMVVLQAKHEESPSLQVDFPLSVVQIRHDGAIAPLIGLGYITEMVHGREFRISATSFFQANTAQAATLVDLVLSALALESGETVLDAYCGVGLFTAFLSERAEVVIGIEADHAATADADHNLADAENVDLYEGPVEEVLPLVTETLNAAVVDPPRTGLEPEVVDVLAAHHALARLVYVSCDPATLARDAQRLIRHGYTLQWVQPVDMFPQTYHVESVALFTKQSATQ
jgi:23S rRNA (uracil1939-C5)-methyltransferase